MCNHALWSAEQLSGHFWESVASWLLFLVHADLGKVIPMSLGCPELPAVPHWLLVLSHSAFPDHLLLRP
jgi:hypothetical protein